MKEKLVMVVLIFSLTVNAAALITMGYLWGREHGTGQTAGKDGGHDPFRGELSLDPGQRVQMRDIRESFMNQTAPLRQALSEKRVGLANLLAAEGTDNTSLEQKLREINELQLRMQFAVIDQLRKEKEFLTPGQRQRYAEIISRRLCQDPMRGGRGPRRYRGRGMGEETGGMGGMMGAERKGREHTTTDE